MHEDDIAGEGFVRIWNYSFWDTGTWLCLEDKCTERGEESIGGEKKEQLEKKKKHYNGSFNLGFHNGVAIVTSLILPDII